MRLRCLAEIERQAKAFLVRLHLHGLLKSHSTISQLRLLLASLCLHPSKESASHQIQVHLRHHEAMQDHLHLHQGRSHHQQVARHLLHHDNLQTQVQEASRIQDLHLHHLFLPRAQGQCPQPLQTEHRQRRHFLLQMQGVHLHRLLYHQCQMLPLHRHLHLLCLHLLHPTVLLLRHRLCHLEALLLASEATLLQPQRQAHPSQVATD